jgi:HAD superfamily hydrolase (TIGR01459 family)
MSKGQLVTTGLSQLAADYDALFCDIWGVVHNGVAQHPGAVAALTRYREEGGRVVLVTNASRPAPQIAEMLASLDIGEAAYDRIVSSGDVTRELVRAYTGKIIHFVGPQTDHPMLQGLSVAKGEPGDAAVVVVTGLDRRGERPEEYTDRLKDWLSHRLPLICANPDLTVEVGDSIEYCAGAIAALYSDMGGRVEMAGKPYPPIYEAAFHQLEEAAGRTLDRKRVLAVGDAVRTDALGAATFGLDFLFITGSLHAEELNAHAGADEEHVKQVVAPSNARLVGYMPRLVW